MHFTILWGLAKVLHSCITWYKYFINPNNTKDSVWPNGTTVTKNSKVQKSEHEITWKTGVLQFTGLTLTVPVNSWRLAATIMQFCHNNHINRLFCMWFRTLSNSLGNSILGSARDWFNQVSPLQSRNVMQTAT